MSAPIAGKFQDHYEVLGVEPNAELETIQRVYSQLAQEYHPGNPETGNQVKFDALNLAYEILSQHDLRREFDKLIGLGEDKSAPKFTGLPFFGFWGRENGLRAALLCVLYDRRRQKPSTPSLSVRHVENILSCTLDEMTLVLWYLKERRLVISDDKSSLQITVDGMDFLEKNPPTADIVMPFIKASGLAGAPRTAPAFDEGSDAIAESATEVADDQSGEAVYALADAVATNTPPIPDDPARRANLNRILSRGTN